ncbi:unnamed protein product [Didymodactylos carnosus]|uniref:LRRCT domain-containing protein n=3 Tax=Didymodactylos carnosus TaxID=1234261 RepID=A0A813W8E7_9BILA|nr:unnamed protein product [Didymodactylos carnosus]CAF3635348.1 unnamed protein product [Didymodactylos carnosus]
MSCEAKHDTISTHFQSICQSGIREDNSNYIHCARKQLQIIPDFSRINTFYDELVLNDNLIQHIPVNAFSGLRVKRLSLQGNKIQSIESQAFIELANYLEELVIEFDQQYMPINKIPDAILKNLYNIRSLILTGLNLHTLSNDTFQYFKKLEKFSCIKCNLVTIDDMTFDSNKIISITLKELHLDNNKLSDLNWSKICKNLKNLEILTLSQNHFQTLTNNLLTNLTQLKLFDLSYNGLQTIDTNIFINQSLTLEKLYLQNNELNSLQLTFLFNLYKLTDINIEFNRITFLPEQIFQYNKQLLYLSLQGNDLTKLSNQSFLGLSNLKYLNLARNRIQLNISDHPFQYLNKLQILNLDRNSPLKIYNSTFYGLEQSLIELSLQNCNLTLIFSDGFNYFEKLERLKLASNNLKSLPYNFLKLSKNLTSLDLQRNQFQIIPKLFYLTQLHDLDLSTNRLCTINEENIIPIYPQLKTIGLTGNPLHCNCKLKWLIIWLDKNYDRDLIKFLQWICITPKKLNNKPLTSLTIDDLICNDDDEQNMCENNKDNLILTTNTIDTNRITEISTTMIMKTKIKILSSNQNVNMIKSNQLIINVEYDNINNIFITWNLITDESIKYYHLQIYDEDENLIKQMQKLLKNYQYKFDISSLSILKYKICINIIYIDREDKYCRNYILKNLTTIKTHEKNLQLIKNEYSSSIQYIFLFAGALLGAVLVCLIVFIICFIRIRHKQSKITRQTCLYHESSNRSSSSSNSSSNKSDQQQKISIPDKSLIALYDEYQPPIFYHPLHLQSQQEQKKTNHQHYHDHCSIHCNNVKHHQNRNNSSDISECSLHLTDTSHLNSVGTSTPLSSSYHIYQQIPSVHNLNGFINSSSCHLHGTLTPTSKFCPHPLNSLI